MSTALELNHVWKKICRGEFNDCLRAAIPALVKSFFGFGPPKDELAQRDFWALSELILRLRKESSCRRMILKDLHSWIFQYVIEAGVSKETPQAIEKLNLQQLHFTKKTLPGEIYFYNDRSHYFKFVYWQEVKNILRYLAGYRKRDF